MLETLTTKPLHCRESHLASTYQKGQRWCPGEKTSLLVKHTVLRDVHIDSLIQQCMGPSGWAQKQEIVRYRKKTLKQPWMEGMIKFMFTSILEISFPIYFDHPVRHRIPHSFGRN